MKKKTIFPLSILAISILGIVAILYLSKYVRPVSDDFPFLSHNNILNFADFIAYCLSATGRISSIFLYIIGYSIPGLLFIMPTIGVFIVFIGLFLLTKLLLFNYINKNILIIFSLAISMIVVLVSLLITPGLYASLFWFTSATVHVWSYGMVMIYSYILFKNKSKQLTYKEPKFLILFFAMPLFVSMFSETASIVILTLTILSFIFYRNNANNYQAQISLCGICASSIGVIILYFWPGSIDRRIALQDIDRFSIFSNITQTPSRILNDIFNVIPRITPNQSLLLLILTIGFIIGLFYFKNRVDDRKILFTGFYATVLLFAVYLINISLLFIMTPQPVAPYRLYFLPSLILSVLAMIYGMLLGLYIKKYSKMVQGIVFGILIAICGNIIIHQNYVVYLINMKSSFKNHAIEIDRRDIFIRKQIKNNICIISAKKIELPGVDDLTTDINGAVNRSIYNYYNPKKAKESAHLRFFEEQPTATCGIRGLN